MLDLNSEDKKCYQFAEEIHYLGHVVRLGSLLPESAKRDKIQQWPRPDFGTGLASFLGLINYYRTLVLSFANVTMLYIRRLKLKWLN